MTGEFPGDGPDEVWYVAYGSNLSSVRLRAYLTRCEPSTDPLDRRPMALDHRLFFAHHSTRWGGGCAFVDPVRDALAGTLATAWLLPTSQFLGIWLAENGATDLGVDLDLTDLGPGSSHPAHPQGRYGLVLGCASPDHRPAVTFTTPERPLPAATVPSESYVDTIVDGLVEGHGLTPTAARDYVLRRVTAG